MIKFGMPEQKKMIKNERRIISLQSYLFSVDLSLFTNPSLLQSILFTELFPVHEYNLIFLSIDLRT